MIDKEFYELHSGQLKKAGDLLGKSYDDLIKFLVLSYTGTIGILIQIKIYLNTSVALPIIFVAISLILIGILKYRYMNSTAFFMHQYAKIINEYSDQKIDIEKFKQRFHEIHNLLNDESSKPYKRIIISSMWFWILAILMVAFKL